MAENQEVFIGGVSSKSTAKSITTALTQLGSVAKVDIFRKKSCAVAKFDTPEAAKLAISTHWLVVDDKRVEILPFEPGKMHLKEKS